MPCSPLYASVTTKPHFSCRNPHATISLWLQVLQPGDAFVATAEQCGDEDVVRDAAKAAAALFRMVSGVRAEEAVGGEALLRLWSHLARATADLLARGGASVDFATDWQGVSTGAVSFRGFL